MRIARMEEEAAQQEKAAAVEVGCVESLLRHQHMLGSPVLMTCRGVVGAGATQQAAARRRAANSKTESQTPEKEGALQVTSPAVLVVVFTRSGSTASVLARCR